jgi:hypothetical protein
MLCVFEILREPVAGELIKGGIDKDPCLSHCGTS